VYQVNTVKQQVEGIKYRMGLKKHPQYPLLSVRHDYSVSWVFLAMIMALALLTSLVFWIRKPW
jgi:hypothetical protein